MFFSLFKKEKITVRTMSQYLAKLDGKITCIKKIPGLAAEYSGFAGLAPEIVNVLKNKGIDSLYSHQCKAISLALSGRDTVIATPTASGKTLCYNLPVINSILNNKDSRALYLFPTKALANDQLTEITNFIKELKKDIRCFTYDGDTPSQQRREAKNHGQIIISNPDMLNAGIMPHHSSWTNFFRNLDFIVIDELHTYRGVFGSHLANLFRRLERICAFYGSNPVFICCSATIANPAEHAEILTGREMVLVSKNGAPSPKKEIIIYNPPIVNKRTRIRRSSLFEVSRIAADALCADISTIIFTRSRINVELLLKQIRKEITSKGGDPSIVTGYRAGYLPKERRKIELNLRTGKLRGVISTNALELGIDIGSLELAILHGYPGSIASAWQQIGRAGRRGTLSSAIMVPSALAMDQFLSSNTEWFFGASSEIARIDPKNPYIQVGHVKCSAFELPFREGEKFGGEDITEILDYFTEHKVLNKEMRFETFYYNWRGTSYPASELSLRSATPDVYTILDISIEKNPRVIGNMDKQSASIMIYPGAVYFHGGQSYIVYKLDSENMSCLVKSAVVDYYTESKSSTHITVIEELEKTEFSGWGEVIIATTPYMYKKIRLSTHENIGQGSIDLSEQTVETTAAWISMPEDSLNNPELKVGMDGLEKLLKNTAPLFLMCDRNDIQVHSRLNDPYVGHPAIFIADNIPGGVGLAEGAYELQDKLLKASLDLLSSCSCSDGCPACVGAASYEYDAKSIVHNFISDILIRNRENRL
ncbi:MAG: DEAD/DEAH box helicase [Synergistaceae bacterium]|nr:DEAD/DEAH box helicase [Synergistaceae bacterium]